MAIHRKDDVNVFKDYFQEVRFCTCETFQQRYGHLKSALVLSALFFVIHFLIIRAPFLGTDNKLFIYEIIGASFIISGFLFSMWLGKRFIYNQILVLPTIGCLAAAAMNLIIPEYYQAAHQNYLDFLLIGIFYGSYISSIRCNLLLNIFASALPFILGAVYPHLDLNKLWQEMPIVYFMGLLGCLFSYRLNSYQKKLSLLQKNLREETASLEEAQLVAKIGNWKYSLTDGKIIWSKQMYSIFPENFHQGELTFARLRSSIHPDDFNNWFSTLKNCLRDGKTYKIQFRTYESESKTFPKEEVWVESIVQAVKSKEDEITGLFGTCQNITEYKTIEQLLEQEKVKMIQTAKLATLGEMSAGVAHEINNPLTIIQGNALMLKLDNITHEKKLDKIEKILSSVERVTKIVYGLRKFSRSAEGYDKSHFPLKQFFEEIKTMVETKSKLDNVPVYIEHPHNIENISLFGDEIQIEQILINLINNAIDQHSQNKGSWVKVSYREFDEKTEVIVKDSGHGISQEIQSKLFDPFFTTKGIGKGTGLGLSISKGIAQEHDGDLYYQLIDGHTAFVISLPKVNENKKNKDAA